MCFMPKPQAPVIQQVAPGAAPRAAAPAAPAPAPVKPVAPPKPTQAEQDALKPREAPKPPMTRESSSGSKSSATVTGSGRKGTILAPISGGGQSLTGGDAGKKTLLGA